MRIFSASSSGISMSKASSKAMTSSTVSSESAPRSSTNDALAVTSPSSTPNCSTMICFTLSSTAAMFFLACLYIDLNSVLRLLSQYVYRSGYALYTSHILTTANGNRRTCSVIVRVNQCKGKGVPFRATPLLTCNCTPES
ncbi:exported hypothetical protein [Candidatus Sulfotelmatobacter kueseliae]|uniref:Uncharacterized protein n=1 Tax=Candidatus Sulfotelmatobacter kueseliae TaxID=2042962 RepID=A0A2U3KYK4_9BACT|nr:exported hypothetical protein [Candidatus Sulfotelmatobacter kueseliae]